jgi:hypothetical protein
VIILLGGRSKSGTLMGIGPGLCPTSEKPDNRKFRGRWISLSEHSRKFALKVFSEVTSHLSI